jgi:hypothetical protein
VTQRSGRTWWTADRPATVREATIGAGRIALDLSFDDRRYTVVLGPAASGPAAWEGSWLRRDLPSRGLASGRLYRAADGAFALAGEWHEDGRVYRWVVELDGEPPTP